jgi:hypothetical protein
MFARIRHLTTVISEDDVSFGNKRVGNSPPN